jgi:hypothetical protein
MKRTHAILLVLLTCLAPVPGRAATADSDPRAVKVAEDVMHALGGHERWNALPGLRWSFGASRHDTVLTSRRHAWNKLTGQHRVEGRMRDGSPFVIVHALGDSTRGAAWVNGHAIEGDSLRKLVRRAHAMWVNDSYWFLMPYKMLDPGVHLGLEAAGADTLANMDCVTLRFDQVGLTPGDRYWVFVNRRTHRVERWNAWLQGQPGPASMLSTWEGWEPHDGLWFPTRHRDPDGDDLFTNAVETVKAFRPGEFDAP